MVNAELNPKAHFALLCRRIGSQESRGEFIQTAVRRSSSSGETRTTRAAPDGSNTNSIG